MAPTFPSDRPQPTPDHFDHEKEMTLFIMLSGVLAGAVMTVLMAFARLAGLTTFNLERSFGLLLIGEGGNTTWIVGLIMHLAISMIFALIYAEGFRRLHLANPKIGAAFGVIHWLAIGIFIGIMPSLRPVLAPTLSEAGPFALHLGVFGFFFLLLVHLLYGAMVGSAYLRLAQEHPEVLQARRLSRRNESHSGTNSTTSI